MPVTDSPSSVAAGPSAAPAPGRSASELLAHVDALFMPGSALAAQLPQWHARPGQQILARAVAQAIEDRAVLLAEAGTGTGKTLAYLVPALLHGGRLIVSTATRHLQDQLFGKDLPAAQRALGLALTARVLKGRANYVCLYRLRRAGDAVHGRDAHAELRRISQFAQSDAVGDLSILPGWQENAALGPLVTSTAENCLGSDCPDFKPCFVMKARREALAADVVVINHHLFFADLALRGEGVAELLPNADTIVLDEAHQLAEIGVQFMGSRVGTAQVVELARDLLACGLQHARGFADWATLSAQLERAARDLRLTAPETGGRLSHEQALALPGWDAAQRNLVAQLQRTAAGGQALAETSPEFDRIAARATSLAQAFEHWGASEADTDDCRAADPRVRWLDVGSAHLRLQSAPLQIASAFAALLAQRSQSWVLVSATLTVGGSFAHAREQLGLTQPHGGCTEVEDGVPPRCRTLRVPSPFDYARQARLLVPPDLPLPSHPGHSAAVAALAARLAAVNHGGTLVLTTTLRAARVIAQQLRLRLPGRTVLEQFDESKPALLARLAATPGAVLVGSHSFWEGVDLPGDRLTLLVIDKLPFAPPDDPVHAARLQRIEAEGRSGFTEYSLPQAALALQQGAGRLIRGEADRGVLVIADRRLTATGWGRQLLASLPPFGRAASVEEAAAFLRDIRPA